MPAGPDYPHQIVNTSDAPLKYLSISTQERPEIVEYPDSGKYLAMTGAARTPDFARMSRLDDGSRLLVRRAVSAARRADR